MSTSSVAEFAARMRRLEALACPTDQDIPFFNEQIQIASRHGLNYRECLEFIVRERHGGADQNDGWLLSTVRLRSRTVVLLSAASMSLLAGCSFSILGQSAAATTSQTSGPVLRYSPQSNLERSEMETLGRARVSIDVAMYSFTDRELAGELCRLVRAV